MSVFNAPPGAFQTAIITFVIGSGFCTPRPILFLCWEVDGRHFLAHLFTLQTRPKLVAFPAVFLKQVIKKHSAACCATTTWTPHTVERRETPSGEQKDAQSSLWHPFAFTQIQSDSPITVSRWEFCSSPGVTETRWQQQDSTLFLVLQTDLSNHNKEMRNKGLKGRLKESSDYRLNTHHIIQSLYPLTNKEITLISTLS